jgi:heme exporter protein D
MLYVREGSLPTKPIWEQWRVRREALREAPRAVQSVTHAVRHLEKILWKWGEGAVIQEDLESIYGDLEWLATEVAQAMSLLNAVVPLRRRIELLEQVEGRTPEEAAAFQAKAAELRQKLDNPL